MLQWVLATLLILSAQVARATELGEITEVDQGKLQIQFYIGDLDVKEGEVLSVLNSNNQADIKMRVVSVKPPYATAEFSGYQYQAGFSMVEPLHKGRRVRLVVDASTFASFSFFAGLDNSQKVGDFGGTGYSLGLSVIIPIKDEWIGSLQLQADDLGKDSEGNGKRVSYYMAGAGRRVHGFELLAHLGTADNMTMPTGGHTTTDPYTGAPYPDNVQHQSKFGYLLMVKYPIYFRTPSRTDFWGWGVSPMATYGGSFGSDAYKPTTTLSIAIDFVRPI